MSYPEIVEEVKRLPFHEQLLLMEVLTRPATASAAPCQGFGAIGQHIGSAGHSQA